MAGNIGGSAEGGRIGFIPLQLLLVSPVLVPVWVAGLPRSLPRAYSGHNGLSEWGEPGPLDGHALLVGFDGANDAAPFFSGCRRVGRVDNGVGLQNDEQGSRSSCAGLPPRGPASGRA